MHTTHSYESFADPAIPKFMYGSHYSTAAGVVLHYLVRLQPFADLHREMQASCLGCTREGSCVCVVRERSSPSSAKTSHPPTPPTHTHTHTHRATTSTSPTASSPPSRAPGG
jgi:hypothetical protein